MASKRRTRAQQIGDLIAEITGNGAEMVAIAAEMMRDPEADKADRRWAIEFLMERCAGKATVVVENDTRIVVGVAHRFDPKRLTDEQIEAQEKLLRAGMIDVPDEGDGRSRLTPAELESAMRGAS